MVRELSRRPVSLAVLAGLGLLPLAAQADPLLTLDLRAPGGGKVAATPAVGGTVTLEVWAVIANGDSNHANDGFLTGQFNVLSNDTPSSLLGNMAGMVFTPSFQNTTTPPNPMLSQPGTVQNLDGNATNDNELGGSDVDNPGTPFTNNNWVSATGVTGNSTSVDPNDPNRLRMATVFGTGTGSGVTELELGTVTWTRHRPARRTPRSTWPCGIT